MFVGRRFQPSTIGIIGTILGHLSRTKTDFKRAVVVAAQKFLKERLCMFFRLKRSSHKDQAHCYAGAFSTALTEPEVLSARIGYPTLCIT